MLILHQTLSQPPTSFLALPNGFRNMVYDELTATERTILYPLVATCKQIRGEALPIIFARITLYLELGVSENISAPESGRNSGRTWIQEVYLRRDNTGDQPPTIFNLRIPSDDFLSFNDDCHHSALRHLQHVSFETFDVEGFVSGKIHFDLGDGTEPTIYTEANWDWAGFDEEPVAMEAYFPVLGVELQTELQLWTNRHEKLSFSWKLVKAMLRHIEHYMMAIYYGNKENNWDE